jgi:hypothetical protein
LAVAQLASGAVSAAKTDTTALGKRLITKSESANPTAIFHRATFKRISRSHFERLHCEQT